MKQFTYNKRIKTAEANYFITDDFAIIEMHGAENGDLFTLNGKAITPAAAINAARAHIGNLPVMFLTCHGLAVEKATRRPNINQTMLPVRNIAITKIQTVFVSESDADMWWIYDNYIRAK